NTIVTGRGIATRPILSTRSDEGQMSSHAIFPFANMLRPLFVDPALAAICRTQTTVLAASDESRIRIQRREITTAQSGECRHTRVWRRQLAWRLVGRGGLEPPTSAVSARRS